VRWRAKAVVQTVDVRDGDAGELFVGYVLKAAKVHAVHDTDRRFRPDTEGPDAAHATKVVLILLGVKQILRELRLAGEKTEAFRLDYRWPEARSPADGAVATIRTLREIEVGLELHSPAVATAAIGLQHFYLRFYAA